MTPRAPRRHAVVLGDRDLAAPLHAAGVSVAAVCDPAASNRLSRYYSSCIGDPRPDEDALAAAVVLHAQDTAGPVALFYQGDDELLFVSRRRHVLAEHLRFVIPDAHLVEELVDKAAFHELAARLDLPVPATRILDVTEASRDLEAVQLPVLVKPLRREKAWTTVSPAKAVLVQREDELGVLLAELLPEHSRVLLQTLVPGPETQIESYHAYIDESGSVVGEFTGRKVRTYPRDFGHSTAVVTTDSEDVTQQGRTVLEKLDLRGVAKVDFKRDLDGRLWLLEVNPRFNLWHHVGAAAGVNIPALVFADLMGLERGSRSRARAGVSWCNVKLDWLAARDSGVGAMDWLRWLSRCKAWSGLDFRDPVPAAAKAIAVVREGLQHGVVPARRR